MASKKIPAGWYPDPSDPSRSRYWDGRKWTDRTRRSDPLSSAGAPRDEQQRYEQLMNVSPAERAAKRGCLPWWSSLIFAYIVVVIVAIATGSVE